MMSYKEMVFANVGRKTGEDCPLLDWLQRGEFQINKCRCTVISNMIFVTIILSASIIIIFAVTNRCITLDIFTKRSYLL